MGKKIISSALVLLILVTAVACGSGEQQITGQELIDGVIASIENQETCRYEGSMAFTMSGTFDDEYTEVGYSMDMDVVSDFVAKEFQVDGKTITKVRALTQTEEIVEFKLYILDDMAYMGFVIEGSPDQWIKGDSSDDFWDSQDLAKSQIALIRGGEAAVLGTEKVKGIDCYMAEISPDIDELLEYMSSQIQQEDLSVELTEDSISNYIMKGWFAEDTFFPMKYHQEFDMKVDIYGDEANYHFIIDILFYDWNKSVSIELPPEADDAEYVGPMDDL